MAKSEQISQITAQDVDKFFEWSASETWSPGTFVLSRDFIVGWDEMLSAFQPYGDGPNNVTVFVSKSRTDAEGCALVRIVVRAMDQDLPALKAKPGMLDMGRICVANE